MNLKEAPSYLQVCALNCCRPAARRLDKQVMELAGIEGKHASTKDLGHGFGVAMLNGEKPMPLNRLRDLKGHADTKTTEIYLQSVGVEMRNLVMQAWES